MGRALARGAQAAGGGGENLVEEGFDRDGAHALRRQGEAVGDGQHAHARLDARQQRRVGLGAVAADEGEIALDDLQAVLDAVVHLQHQHAIVGERGLQRALAFARLDGHGVEGFGDVAQLRRHFGRDRGGGAALGLAPLQARGQIDALDPAHDVAADRQRIDIGEQAQHAELREAQHDETAPFGAIGAVVEAQQHAKTGSQRRQRESRRLAGAVDAAKGRGAGGGDLGGAPARVGGAVFP